MTMISVPVFGCWQITGHYKDQDVTFTIWVTSYTEQETSLHALALAFRSPPARKAVVQRVHIDSEVQAKSLVYRVLPEIPPTAQAAIEAVRRWRYRINVVSLEPFEAQEVDTTISVLFPPP